MKKVFIDERLKNYIVPTEMRNMSVTPSGVIYTPGTRIPLPKDMKYLRLFTAWGHNKENKKRINFDIDLSSMFVKGEEFVSVGYYNQHSDFASLSGDITYCDKWNDKNVVAEFLDVDFEKAVEEGIEYAVIAEFIFSSHNLHHSYGDEVTVYSGVKLLDKRASRTDKIDISDSFIRFKIQGNFQSHMPFAIDFKKRELVVIDFYDTGRAAMNGLNQKSNLLALKKKYFDAVEYSENMFDFLSLYCKANDIKVVKDIENAETIISYEDICASEEQVLFNVSDNLEKIISLLSK